MQCNSYLLGTEKETYQEKSTKEASIEWVNVLFLKQEGGWIPGCWLYYSLFVFSIIVHNSFKIYDKYMTQKRRELTAAKKYNGYLSVVSWDEILLLATFHYLLSKYNMKIVIFIYKYRGTSQSQEL